MAFPSVLVRTLLESVVRRCTAHQEAMKDRLLYVAQLAASACGGGQHTMPDGTTMEGHQHPQGETHVMPDGGSMTGAQHGGEH